MTEAEVAARLAPLADLRGAIATAIVGQDDVVEQLLIGLFAGGHCLLEGVPGLGKTHAGAHPRRRRWSLVLLAACSSPPT